MIQDVEQLLTEFESGRFVRPDSALRNPVSLARAVSAQAGYDRWSGDTVADEIGRQIGQPDHIVMVVADGFGMNFVSTLPESSFSRSNLAWQQPAVFPSGTGPNMTSLYSGEWPAEHGFIGWWMYLPQIEEPTTVYEWVRTSDGAGLESLGVRPDDVFLSKPLAPSINIDFLLLMPEPLKDTIPTRHTATGGAPVQGYGSLTETAETVAHRVQSAKGKTLTILYWANVDSMAHRHGVSAPETVSEVQAFDAAMGELSAALNGNTRMIVTADHGHLDVPGFVELVPGDPLAQLLKCSRSGDGRVNHFHVRDEQQERFTAGFVERFGDEFLLLSTNELIDRKSVV